MLSPKFAFMLRFQKFGKILESIFVDLYLLDSSLNGVLVRPYNCFLSFGFVQSNVSFLLNWIVWTYFNSSKLNKNHDLSSQIEFLTANFYDGYMIITSFMLLSFCLKCWSTLKILVYIFLSALLALIRYCGNLEAKVLAN